MPAKKKKITTSINSVDNLISVLQKDHGTDIVIGEGIDTSIEWMSTGIPSLDWVLGKGIPNGRIIEVYGPESSGKTTLCLHCIAKAQRKGGKCAFIDAEYSYDPDFAKSFGVDDDNLVKVVPNYGEQALDALETMVESDLFEIIVVDSVAALVPKVEMEGEMGDQQMGLQARMMSKALRKLTAIIGKTKTTVFFINQIRKRIGVMFGNPETTAGGEGLKFYASIRIDVRRRAFIGDKNDNNKVINPEGIIQKVKVIKNKCSKPFRETMLDLTYDKGYDVIKDLFNTAVNFGIITKSGAWYSFQGNQLGQGEAKSMKILKSNKEWLRAILKEVKESFQEQC